MFKTSTLFVLISFLFCATVFAEEDPAYEGFATFEKRFSLTGMQIPGELPGASDRVVVFRITLDPTNEEVANEVWYSHLELCLGQQGMSNFRNKALNWTRGKPDSSEE